MPFPIEVLNDWVCQYRSVSFGLDSAKSRNSRYDHEGDVQPVITPPGDSQSVPISFERYPSFAHFIAAAHGKRDPVKPSSGVTPTSDVLEATKALAGSRADLSPSTCRFRRSRSRLAQTSCRKRLGVCGLRLLRGAAAEPSGRNFRCLRAANAAAGFLTSLLAAKTSRRRSPQFRRNAYGQKFTQIARS